MYLTVTTNVTSANEAPTTETQGVPLKYGADKQAAGEGFKDHINEALLAIYATVTAAAAGSIGTAKVWLWIPNLPNAGTNKWVPAGTDSTDSNRGRLNENSAIGEIATGDDVIRFCEVIRNFRYATRIYIEYSSLSNITRIDAVMVAPGEGVSY